jgi:hypothetical protein
MKMKSNNTHFNAHLYKLLKPPNPLLIKAFKRFTLTKINNSKGSINFHASKFAILKSKKNN